MTGNPDPLNCCWRCSAEHRATLSGWAKLQDRMILCSKCGNKRCPKATYHGNECTDSNESGQPGSMYQ